MRRRKLTVLIALVAALVVPVAVPAPAMASVTGSIAFQCTAKLPAWPSPSSFGVCDSDATPAVGYVSLAGTDDNGLIYLVKGDGPFAAAFDYQSACIAGEPSVTGTAQGIGTVRGVRAFHSGVLTTADVHGWFQWTRIGGDAMINITQWRIDFANGGSAYGSSGSGNASFAPLAGPSNVCPVGGPLKAFVQGDVDAVN